MKNEHIVTYTTYTIEDHPDPDQAYQWIRENWHDLGQYVLSEAVESLKVFFDHFSLSRTDYSISLLGDRGEHITGYVPDELENLSGNRLRTYLVNNFPEIDKDCPFTGVCYDDFLLQPMRDHIKKPTHIDYQELIEDCFYSLLKSIHSEGGYIYSDEGLHELCEANEYEFLESGEVYY